ncbi:hypothetical protein A2U01_0109278, partial [Trifolium medium]|nr:hypothetical protein [Trifolium medium]
MWCLPLFEILEHWYHYFSPSSPDSPTSGLRAVVRLGGGAGGDP